VIIWVANGPLEYSSHCIVVGTYAQYQFPEPASAFQQAIRERSKRVGEASLDTHGYGRTNLPFHLRHMTNEDSPVVPIQEQASRTWGRSWSILVLSHQVQTKTYIQESRDPEIQGQRVLGNRAREAQLPVTAWRRNSDSAM
jgi:hypothetical protein